MTSTRFPPRLNVEPVRIRQIRRPHIRDRTARDFSAVEYAVAIGVVKIEHGLDGALGFGPFDLPVAIAILNPHVSEGRGVFAGGIAMFLSMFSCPINRAVSAYTSPPDAWSQ